jgi:hypothetical protein
VTSEEAEIARLSEAILDYLQRNPEAADTLGGIVNWWLPAEAVHIEASRVERALEQLVAKGFAVKRVLVGGSVVYARAASRER